jgi:outer membrane receptor protein involved in Fe transport
MLVLAATLLVALRVEAQTPQDPAGTDPDATRMGEIVVRGRADNLVGVAESASEGVVGHDQIERRPLLRASETLETVPGLIATQHSGSGKANQYFLRGFNLDHGTDLAVSFDGIPLNLPSHGHGQGYTDLNFVIPELIREVEYKKGPYYPEVGDFGSAGAFQYRYFDVLPEGIVKLAGGQFDYGRALAANSTGLLGGNLLYALEGGFNGGPWDHTDAFWKVNGLLRYSRGDERDGLSVTGLGYYGHWNSTDQVAVRAIDQGIIDEFGALDPSDAGESGRYLLSGEWHGSVGPGQAQVLAYAYYYDLKLFSNFTYFLDDPVDGDQFEQKDRRFVVGLVPTYQWSMDLFGKTLDNTVGLQLRSDRIRNGLYDTEDRNRSSATRHDRILETSVGLFVDNRIRWTDWFRTELGGRVDFYDFDVDSSLQANSNGDSDAIVSPKGSLVFGPWYDTELYLNGGFGFHSNDARGVAGRIDPKSGDAVDRADPLVRSKGAEIGIRTARIHNLRSSVAFFLLDIDSELLFVGDAGTNEPSRPSRRYGVEIANYWSPTPWLTFDGDLSLSHARFRSEADEGDHIPGSIETVVALGVSVHDLYGFFGSLRLRYFGPRPLIEDDSVRSNSSKLVNLRVGYEFDEHWSLALDVFNLFDARPSDIDYFYTSRLPGEPPEGVDDIHTHPAEPRAFRGTLTYRFGE